MQKTGGTNHTAFQFGHFSSLVWSRLVWYLWSDLKWKKSFTYGFDHLDAVNNHFLVYKAIWAWWQPNERKTGWCRRKPALDQWEGSLLQKGFLGPSLNQDYWGFSMWPFWRHGCCSNCLICYEEYCVYLSFALLSELQNFGLLCQYYRPLGS